MVMELLNMITANRMNMTSVDNVNQNKKSPVAFKGFMYKVYGDYKELDELAGINGSTDREVMYSEIDMNIEGKNNKRMYLMSVGSRISEKLERFNEEFVDTAKERFGVKVSRSNTELKRHKRQLKPHQSIENDLKDIAQVGKDTFRKIFKRSLDNVPELDLESAKQLGPRAGVYFGITKFIRIATLGIVR